MNITELKELAEKATPGPWEWDGDVSNYDPENEAPWLAQAPWTSRDSKNVLMGTIKAVRAEDAAYIAAANPAAILELIAKFEDAQGEIRALRATEAGLVERVKELEEGVAWFKVRVNTLAALGLKAERFDFGGRLKYDMTALLEKKE